MPDWVIKYWLEWLFGLLIAIMGMCYKHLSSKLKREREERMERAAKDAEELKSLKDGMRSLLRRNIIADCEVAQQEGYCDSTKKDTIKDMYESYKGLGGNGVVKIMYEQTMTLRTFKLAEKGDQYDD